jgi:hypothetical protein
MIAQRDVHDPALDRRHRREQLLPSLAGHALGHGEGAALEVLVPLLLELLAVELDLLLDLPSDQGLVHQHLHRVEQLAVTVGQAAPVDAVQADQDLGLVLLGAHDHVEFRQRERGLAPLANRLRAFRLLPLCGDVAEERLEVADGQVTASAPSPSSTAATA